MTRRPNSPGARHGLLCFAAAAALVFSGAAHAETALDGSWNVDLTTDPTRPYLKPMVLTLRPDGAVEGRFYDSPILAGRWISARGRLCVSFRTTDGRGPYHTSACRAGDVVQGQTWAEHRNFLFPWTAARPAATASPLAALGAVTAQPAAAGPER